MGNLRRVTILLLDPVNCDKSDVIVFSYDRKDKHFVKTSTFHNKSNLSQCQCCCQSEAYPSIYIVFKKPLKWKKFIIILHDDLDFPEAVNIHPVFYFKSQNESVLRSIDLKINKKSILNINTKKKKCTKLWKSSCTDRKWQTKWFEEHKCHVPFLFFGNHMISRQCCP